MPENNNPPGKNNATASLVLGIIAVIFWFFGYSSILSIILGIVGLIQASKAKELGCNKIALGHHFNDVIETTVMSMFYGSQMQAMPPKLHSTSFPGMTLIRPMYCIREEDILAWKRYNDLEFIQCACRFTENCTMCDNGGGGSKRQETKILLRRLKRDNPNIENSIFRSIHAVALDTMPGYKSEGVEHSFLERFHAQEEAFNEE